MEHSLKGKPVIKLGQPLLMVLLLLSLIRGCLYAAMVPPWQAPDENGHFEYAWLIAHLGRLPAVGEVSAVFESEWLGSLYEWRYGEFIGRPLPSRVPVRIADLPEGIFAKGSRTAMGRFSLAYVWAAIFIWPFRHQDLLLQLYAARLASVTLNLGIVWLAWRIFQLLLPRQPGLSMAMTAFVVFLPQHTFINATVGDGPLAELWASVVLYGWLRLLLQPGRVRDAAAVVGGTLLGVWTKKTVLFLLLLDVGMAVVLLWNAGFQRAKWRRNLCWVLTALGALALLGWGVWQAPAGRWLYSILQGWWSDPGLYWENGRVSVYEAVRYTFESFWAQFGWMNVRAGYGWYMLIYVLVAFAVEGWLLPRSCPWSFPTRAVGLLAGTLLLAVVGWLAFTVGTPTGLGYYQGRYLFPATIPAAFFIVGGWARCTPSHWQHHFPVTAIIVLAALDIAAVALALLPYFYT